MNDNRKTNQTAPTGAPVEEGMFAFAARNFRFLTFGFLFVFLASFGQTFYIGLFGEEIRAAFDLTNRGYGFIYTVGTLGSAFLIAWTGGLFDRWDLRVYVCFVSTMFIIAHFVMATATGVIAIGFAIFLLRQAGQGLMVHTSQASMGRYFDRNRGRAISLVSLGISAGEAVFPSIGIALALYYGWRGAWLATGVVLAVGLIPLNMWLLKGHGERHATHVAERKAAQAKTGEGDWTRGQALRDPNFYLLILPFLAITFLITSLFFHLEFIARAKGWDLKLLAPAFSVYAFVKVPATLAVGKLVDTLSARRLAPFFILPMGAAMLVVAFADHWLSLFAVLALAALSAGGALTIMGAAWAELYGLTHLGRIRSTVMSLWVGAGAASTWILGILLDMEVSTRNLGIGACVLVLATSLAAGIGARNSGRRLAKDDD